MVCAGAAAGGSLQRNTCRAQGPACAKAQPNWGHHGGSWESVLWWQEPGCGPWRAVVSNQVGDQGERRGSPQRGTLAKPLFVSSEEPLQFPFCPAGGVWEQTCAGCDSGRWLLPTYYRNSQCRQACWSGLLNPLGRGVRCHRLSLCMAPCASLETLCGTVLSLCHISGNVSQEKRESCGKEFALALIISSKQNPGYKFKWQSLWGQKLGRRLGSQPGKANKADSPAWSLSALR